MAVAKNSKELFNAIKKEVNLKLSTDIAFDLREMYRQTIQEVVYNAYPKPKQYVRRYTLLANVRTQFAPTQNKLTIYTTTYPNMSDPSYGLVYDLLGLIEYGQGYAGNEYSFYDIDKGGREYANPRPFNRTAFERAKTINYNKYFN